MRGDQAELPGPRGDLGAVGGAELAQDVVTCFLTVSSATPRSWAMRWFYLPAASSRCSSASAGPRSSWASSTRASTRQDHIGQVVQLDYRLRGARSRAAAAFAAGGDIGGAGGTAPWRPAGSCHSPCSGTPAGHTPWPWPDSSSVRWLAICRPAGIPSPITRTTPNQTRTPGHPHPSRQQDLARSDPGADAMP